MTATRETRRREAEAGSARRLAVHFSSATAEWTTPPAVLTRVVQCLGGIDLDPCADAACTVPAAQHFTPADDGLAQWWSGRVYMNPPYGRPIAAWIGKLLNEVAAGHVSAAIALVPARTDTAWFRRLDGWPVAFWHGRLRFGQAPHAAPFPSAVVWIRIPVDHFAATFGAVATIYAPLPDAVASSTPGDTSTPWAVSGPLQNRGPAGPAGPRVL